MERRLFGTTAPHTHTFPADRNACSCLVCFRDVRHQKMFASFDNVFVLCFVCVWVIFTPSPYVFLKKGYFSCLSMSGFLGGEGIFLRFCMFVAFYICWLSLCPNTFLTSSLPFFDHVDTMCFHSIRKWTLKGSLMVYDQSCHPQALNYNSTNHVFNQLSIPPSIF